MCGGKKSAAPAPTPAPVPASYYPEGARTQQDIAAAGAASTPAPTFGSELGTSTTSAAPATGG